MNISKNHVVEFDYVLTDDEGNILDASEQGEPLLYLHGHQNIVPGLEQELEGRKANDSFKV
jgi:FKBP-type peptidyl-prolyl cis-trans isomerase SlyD